MELKWLEDFVSLARTANFSRSANQRNITQSAFSRRIKSLEAWVGTELFDRGTYPVTLTKAGQMFLEAAEVTIRELYAVRDEIREESRAEASTLTFAALHTLSLTFYPRWLRGVEDRIGPLNTRVLAESKTMGGNEPHVPGVRDASTRASWPRARPWTTTSCSSRRGRATSC